MLDKDVILVGSKNEFDTRCIKRYFVNMYKNVRTLHMKGCTSCQYSTFAEAFIAFDSLKEVEEYEETHKNATPFKRCGNCFKK